jgi:hypothetical protein
MLQKDLQCYGWLWMGNLIRSLLCIMDYGETFISSLQCECMSFNMVFRKFQTSVCVSIDYGWWTKFWWTHLECFIYMSKNNHGTKWKGSFHNLWSHQAFWISHLNIYQFPGMKKNHFLNNDLPFEIDGSYLPFSRTLHSRYICFW